MELDILLFEEKIQSGILRLRWIWKWCGCAWS
jgi:hypothetical protein